MTSPSPPWLTAPPRSPATVRPTPSSSRKDLKGSDGQPLTAEDFVLGIQRTCNPDVAGHYQYILTNIVGCDDYYNAAQKSAAEKEELR